MFIKFLKDNNGSTATEYALIAALIAVASIAGITSLGDSNLGLYSNITTEVLEASEEAALL